jgi:hypothetical protein
MRKLLSLLVASILTLGLVASTASADPAKGQKIYLKFMKKDFGMNGVKFCQLHSQDEWADLFANDAAKFKEVFIAKFPDAKKFLEGKKFKKLMPHVKDFAIEYANDSGNVPAC